jgi:hypothetical protein
MESSACYFGTQRTLFCLTLFKLARFSLQTDGIATDVFWVQIYTFSVLATKKCSFAAKTAALLPRGKDKGKDDNELVLFGTCLFAP